MTITLGKKTLFSLLLMLGLLANIFELTHVNVLGISTFLSFCTCILLPGFLFSLILRIRKISFWENLLLIVGLSIAFLEFGGLLLNILFPIFGINNPLAFQNLVIGFDAYGFLLFILAWSRTKQIVVQLQLPRFSAIEKVMYVLPVFFPIFATLGAIILNNGGNNTLTMILLGAIALYTLLLVLLRNKVSVDLYPYAIFFIGIACLFITSLRSWYISGHDIEREFYVFQLANTHHYWSMAFYQDAYNACLSITILPTILTNLLSIQDIYIYKVVFQILFATSPVLVFFIAKNYTSPILAFFTAFLFISFPTFVTDMSMLNRQEIGFIFFGLVVYVMLKVSKTRQFYDSFTRDPSLEISLLQRRILFVIFSFSVVVSHYSTNFVLLGSITFVYLLTRIIFLPFVKMPLTSLLSKSHIALSNIFMNKVFLSLPLVLIVFGMTYFWNSLYTHSSDNASSVILQVVNSVFVHSNNDSKVSDLSSYSIFFAPKPDPNQVFQLYVQSIVKRSNAVNNGQFYSQVITSKYPLSPLPQEQLPPTPFGNLLSSLHIPVSNIQAELKLICAYAMQFFIFVGLLTVFSFKKKKSLDENQKSFDLQFLLLSFSSILLLALITVQPTLSVNYGVLRMFQQFLFILSLPIALGLNSIFFFVKTQKRIFFTGIVVIVLFLNLTGFISHLTGEYSPVMSLDNSGLYYNAYYVRKSDVFALTWLSENHVKNDPVDANIENTNIVLAYGHVFALNEILPPVIRKNAYVFLQISVDRVVVIDDSMLSYDSPRHFLDSNKNLIYSNGQDNIYK